MPYESHTPDSLDAPLSFADPEAVDAAFRALTDGVRAELAWLFEDEHRPGRDLLRAGHIGEGLDWFEARGFPATTDALLDWSVTARRRGDTQAMTQALLLAAEHVDEEQYLRAADLHVAHRQFRDALDLYTILGRWPDAEKAREWEEKLVRNDEPEAAAHLRVVLAEAEAVRDAAERVMNTLLDTEAA